MVLPSRGKSGTFCEKQDNGGKHINDDYPAWETNRYQTETERVSILIEKRQKKNNQNKKKQLKAQTWIYTNKLAHSVTDTHISTRHFSYPFSLYFIMSLEVFAYSKVVLVAQQLGCQLLKQWTVRCPVCSLFVCLLLLQYTRY